MSRVRTVPLRRRRHLAIVAIAAATTALRLSAQEHTPLFEAAILHVQQTTPGLVVLLDRAEHPRAVAAAAEHLGVTAGLAAELVECTPDRQCSIKGGGEATLRFDALEAVGDSLRLGIAISRPLRASQGRSRAAVVWRRLTMVQAAGGWAVVKDELVAMS